MGSSSMVPVPMPSLNGGPGNGGQMPGNGASAASAVASVSPENPQMGRPEDQFFTLNLDKKDIDLTVKIVTQYRNQWATDRLERMRVWMKNVLMYRGVQVLDWHSGSNTWVDSLAWYRQNNKTQDGEDTNLERWINPITLMLGTAFIGNMSREVPLTVVKPQDARILADLTTAAAAEDAIGIIERRNKIRQMVRTEFENLYLYGSYFKHERGVLDGNWSGWDDEPVFGDVQFEKPERMQCQGCWRETPIAQLGAMDGTDDLGGDDGGVPCPGCGGKLGAENYLPSEQQTTLGVTGVQRVPRAMVRMTVHSPMEIDGDPQAKDLAATPILAWDQEIDLGEARMMFPDAWDRIKEGARSSTTANADYEALRRNETYSATSGYSSDTEQQRPTYSQIWVQPQAYFRTGDREYAERMMAAAPQGLKLSMLGPEVVGAKASVLVKEWTLCRLHENFGLYCQSIAENVVTFNERFNSAMQIIDDYMNRAACGMNVVAGDRIDEEKWKGNTLVPATVVPIPMKLGGDRMPLSESFMHFDIPLNPSLLEYPQMLLTFAQLMNGMPPQSFGAGTQPGVETATGQGQMLAQANTTLAPYWENVKEEHALAAQNSIECLQELLKCGAAKEIFDVIEDKGSQFRNNYVNLQKMQGRVKVYPDEDQDLPQTPEQMRQSFTMIFEELSNNNPAAAAIMDVPANQEIIGSTMFPNLVSPISAQRAKTLQDLNTLLEQPGTPVQRPDGSIGAKLPVEPDPKEDFKTAIATIQEFILENCDLRIKNPVGWDQINQYNDMLLDMQSQVAAKAAARGLQVQQAGAPKPQGPDPGTQAAVAELHKLAVQMADQLARLSMTDPMLTGGTITGQVAAGKEVVDAAINATKAMKDK